MKPYDVYSIRNKQGGWMPWHTPCYLMTGCHFKDLAQAKAAARRHVRREGAREAVVVDAVCHADYGVVVYIVRPDVSAKYGVSAFEVDTPFQEWRMAADVPSAQDMTAAEGAS
jgi:hypothetical protein